MRRFVPTRIVMARGAKAPSSISHNMASIRSNSDRGRSDGPERTGPYDHTREWTRRYWRGDIMAPHRSRYELTSAFAA